MVSQRLSNWCEGFEFGHQVPGMAIVDERGWQVEQVIHDADRTVDGEIGSGKQTDPSAQRIEQDTSQHNECETGQGAEQPFPVLAQYKLVDQNLRRNRRRQREYLCAEQQTEHQAQVTVQMLK